MSILIWVVEGRTNDGELRDYECYLFKWAAKKHFEKFQLTVLKILYIFS